MATKFVNFTFKTFARTFSVDDNLEKLSVKATEESRHGIRIHVFYDGAKISVTTPSEADGGNYIEMYGVQDDVMRDAVDNPRRQYKIVFSIRNRNGEYPGQWYSEFAHTLEKKFEPKVKELVEAAVKEVYRASKKKFNDRIGKCKFIRESETEGNLSLTIKTKVITKYTPETDHFQCWTNFYRLGKKTYSLGAGRQNTLQPSPIPVRLSFDAALANGRCKARAKISFDSIYFASASKDAHVIYKVAWVSMAENTFGAAFDEDVLEDNEVEIDVDKIEVKDGKVYESFDQPIQSMENGERFSLSDDIDELTSSSSSSSSPHPNFKKLI